MPLNFVEEIEGRFPLEESFIDHSGQTRRFQISLQNLPAQEFLVKALEIAESEGYTFEVFAAHSIGSALGKLRQKIRKGLATRHLYIGTDGKLDLTHNEIGGVISSQGVVVDGIFLEYEELERILSTHEGFNISIKLCDPSE